MSSNYSFLSPVAQRVSLRLLINLELVFRLIPKPVEGLHSAITKLQNSVVHLKESMSRARAIHVTFLSKSAIIQHASCGVAKAIEFAGHRTHPLMHLDLAFSLTGATCPTMHLTTPFDQEYSLPGAGAPDDIVP